MSASSPGRTSSSIATWRRLKSFYPRSGFFKRLHAARGARGSRFKLDFIAGLLPQGRARDRSSRRSAASQAQIGEVIGLAQHCSGRSPMPWPTTPSPGSTARGAAQLARVEHTYRLFMTEAYPAVRAKIVEKVDLVGHSSYLPVAFQRLSIANPDVRQVPARCLRARARTAIDYKERIKIMKLLWDAIGTEFGARARALRDELFRQAHELVRLFSSRSSRRRLSSGALRDMEMLAERCMAGLRRERLATEHRLPRRVGTFR